MIGQHIGEDACSSQDDSLPALSPRGLKDLTKIFKLLSDETRIRILLHLARRREIHVRALCDLLHQSQPAVSHHLALLRVAGLIDSRKEGKHNYYHIQPERFHDLLHDVFDALPGPDHQIRFEDYVLSYEPGDNLA